MNDAWDTPLRAAMMIGTLGLAIGFVWLFSQPVASKAEKVEAQTRYWMGFSYTFAIVALLMSVLPFLMPQNRLVPDAPMHLLMACRADEGVATATSCGSAGKLSHGQWMLTIGSRVSKLQNADQAWHTELWERVYQVEGGIAVPIHVVFLALVGGAISLTRRVPELQKRMAPSYVGTAEEPRLSPEQAREFLVFQIVQFVSAPFLAIVAYLLIDPATSTVAATSAFAAGFASQTLLVLIRQLIEHLTPGSARSATLGALAGVVRDAHGAAVVGVEVATIGDSVLSTKTDDAGQFVLEGIAGGRRAVEVKGPSASVVQVVEVAAGRTSSCALTLPTAQADEEVDACGGAHGTPTEDHELPAARGGVEGNG